MDAARGHVWQNSRNIRQESRGGGPHGPRTGASGSGRGCPGRVRSSPGDRGRRRWFRPQQVRPGVGRPRSRAPQSSAAHCDRLFRSDFRCVRARRRVRHRGRFGDPRGRGGHPEAGREQGRRVPDRRRRLCRERRCLRRPAGNVRNRRAAGLRHPGPGRLRRPAARLRQQRPPRARQMPHRHRAPDLLGPAGRNHRRQACPGGTGEVRARPGRKRCGGGGRRLRTGPGGGIGGGGPGRAALGAAAGGVRRPAVQRLAGMGSRADGP